MKRILTLSAALLLFLFTLAACGPGAETPSEPVQESAAPSLQPTPSPEPTPTPAPEFTNPLTGEEVASDLSGQKPVAIMLNNLKQALPQQGNSQADIIYEVLAEGGITRMLAVYQDPSQLGLVGSVRSARQYYFELALGHDAVYIHAGGSPEFYETSKSWGISTVDGVNGYYSYAGTGLFWRDRNRIEGQYYAYEHSLLTSGETITDLLTQREVLGPHKSGYTYEMSFASDGTPQGGALANTITVPFSNYKTGVFRYDGETGKYLVEEYGQPYIDGNDGSQVSATNVIILQTVCTVVDDAGRITVDLSSGDGWFACGGRLIPITWEKGGRYDQLRYYTPDGDPLTLGQGNSYVCIIPTSRVIVVE